ncbi:antitoxin [Chromohalobacter nigrandesensis]|uniref:antitoxin n=1 Tax=Chromohalobacter nigrandesensis TaxID=119863 RepID=UPI001FF5AFB3|nr:AbrB/MazE/SpoVT family DNA-binding domain-containing protein [Chromohalobacter nigrandesensis]MCK0745769.1 AbrB/MazE/SpoVT family DNA-binding domain-containing protein [Chromohalobacter nigrandesensis]
MNTERHVRLFRNGRNQAIRIPREFELSGDDALIRREGDTLIIEPIRKPGLLETLRHLSSLDETLDESDEGLLPLDDIKL